MLKHAIQPRTIHMTAFATALKASSCILKAQITYKTSVYMDAIMASDSVGFSKAFTSFGVSELSLLVFTTVYQRVKSSAQFLMRKDLTNEMIHKTNARSIVPLVPNVVENILSVLLAVVESIVDIIMYSKIMLDKQKGEYILFSAFYSLVGTLGIIAIFKWVVGFKSIENHQEMMFREALVYATPKPIEPVIKSCSQSSDAQLVVNVLCSLHTMGGNMILLFFLAQGVLSGQYSYGNLIQDFTCVTCIRNAFSIMINKSPEISSIKAFLSKI